MKFTQLYQIVNEVPHYIVPNTIDLNGVKYIDYKVETWPIKFELKNSYVDVLIRFNELGLLVYIKEGKVWITDGFSNNSLKDSQLACHIISEHGISISEFNNIIVTNQPKFVYIYDD